MPTAARAVSFFMPAVRAAFRCLWKDHHGCEDSGIFVMSPPESSQFRTVTWHQNLEEGEGLWDMLTVGYTALKGVGGVYLHSLQTVGD